MSFNRMERLDNHAVEYYSALKRNKLICAPTKVNLRNILLSKWNQTQKSRCCLIPCSWGPRAGKPNLWGQISKCTASPTGVQGQWENVPMELPGVTGRAYVLIRVWMTYVYPFIKTHRSVHIESRISLYVNNTSVKNKLLCISLKSYLFLYLFSFLRANGQMPQELC